MDKNFKQMAWALYPGRWSMSHITEDYKKTLCGRRKPTWTFDEQFGYRSEDDRGICRRCWKSNSQTTKKKLDSDL